MSTREQRAWLTLGLLALVLIALAIWFQPCCICPAVAVAAGGVIHDADNGDNKLGP